MNDERNIYNGVYIGLNLVPLFPSNGPELGDGVIKSLEGDLINMVKEWNNISKKGDIDKKKYLFIRNHKYHFSKDPQLRVEQEALLDTILLSAKYNINKHRQSR